MTGDGLVTDRDIVFVVEKMKHKTVVRGVGARCWCYCNAAQNDTARVGAGGDSGMVCGDVCVNEAKIGYNSSGRTRTGRRGRIYDLSDGIPCGEVTYLTLPPTRPLTIARLTDGSETAGES